MAAQYLNEGAATFAAAGWSGAGFGDNAELVIEGASSVGVNDNPITVATDQSAATTGSGDGIHYLYVRPTFTRDIGTAASPVITEFDTSYTTGPQLVHSGSGRMYVQGDACAEAVMSGTGELHLLSGTFTTIIVRSGVCYIGENVAFDNLYAQGGTTFVEDHASSDYDVIRHTGGQVDLRRAGTASTSSYELGGTGVLISRLESGQHEKLTQLGGTIRSVRGDIDNYVGLAGTFDATQVDRDVEVGVTSSIRTPSLMVRQSGDAAGSVTFSNVTDFGGQPEFSAAASSQTGGTA